MPAAVVAIAAITTSIIRESPVGGRMPPFDIAGTKVGEGVSVAARVGAKMIVIEGRGVEVGAIFCVGVADGVVGFEV